ncbi:serine protease FAM111A [Danio aesculapii]|uniref:serine protease FAM111A n=1 Tax=Danio aesculapii TaxID=1142201 RepID=UPI0024BF9A4A|nr:serine protease FAM111A [Danio aesculapii]
MSEELNNTQKQETTTTCLCKIETEECSKDLQKEVEEKKHTFRINLDSNTYSVPCNPSVTVIEALRTNQTFMDEKAKFKNQQKQIIIQRSNGEFPRAAVKTDFPCCLVERDEILDITFMKEETTYMERHSKYNTNQKPETLVTFWVKKEGGTNVKRLLKSSALKKIVPYVCVWAFKGEKVKNALKRDGRFNNVIYRKNCGLSEFGSETRYELSIPVDDLDRKAFQVVVISNKYQTDSQESVNTEHQSITSEADTAEKADKILNPINTEPEQKQTENTKKSRASSLSVPKRFATKRIDNSTDTLDFLRNQFQDLLKTLKQRENLKNSSDVQKFFRAEFGKSVENFSEVRKVKQLMKFSDSVCQIRKEGSALGTGFLLFDGFILTNAHVIGIYADLTKVNFAEFTAVFDYEALNSKIKCIPVKKLTSFFYGKDESGCHLDYALLELDDTPKIEMIPLIDCYSANRPFNSQICFKSQICIVGHPGEGVKKMDPCFIIEKEHLQDAANKHIAENADYIHVMTQSALEDNWKIHENQTTYESCFFHGSSGSPVFDADCKLIGVHTGGYVYPKPGNKFGSMIEYSFSMQPILVNIRAQAKIKGLHEIVNKLALYRVKEIMPETPEHDNQSVCEMEYSDEESKWS